MLNGDTKIHSNPNKAIKFLLYYECSAFVPGQQTHEEKELKNGYYYFIQSNKALTIGNTVYPAKTLFCSPIKKYRSRHPFMAFILELSSKLAPLKTDPTDLFSAGEFIKMDSQILWSFKTGAFNHLPNLKEDGSEAHLQCIQETGLPLSGHKKIDVWLGFVSLLGECFFDEKGNFQQEVLLPEFDNNKLAINLKMLFSHEKHTPSMDYDQIAILVSEVCDELSCFHRTYINTANPIRKVASEPIIEGLDVIPALQRERAHSEPASIEPNTGGASATKNIVTALASAQLDTIVEMKTPTASPEALFVKRPTETQATLIESLTLPAQATVFARLLLSKTKVYPEEQLTAHAIEKSETEIQQRCCVIQ